MDLDNLKLDDIDTTDVNLDDEELLEDQKDDDGMAANICDFLVI